MKFSKQVIVSRTFEMPAREFVEHHLREVRSYTDSKGETEYDLLVQCGVNSHFITRVLSIKGKDATDIFMGFDRYAQTDDEKAAHKAACAKLIELLDKEQ